MSGLSNEGWTQESRAPSCMYEGMYVCMYVCGARAGGITIKNMGPRLSILSRMPPIEWRKENGRGIKAKVYFGRLGAAQKKKRKTPLFHSSSPSVFSTSKSRRKVEGDWTFGRVIHSSSSKSRRRRRSELQQSTPQCLPV